MISEPSNRFSEPCKTISLTDNSKLFSRYLLLLIIIIIFYCELVVLITDTRGQKVASYTSAHITKTVFAHFVFRTIDWKGPSLFRHLSGPALTISTLLSCFIYFDQLATSHLSVKLLYHRFQLRLHMLYLYCSQHLLVHYC